MAVGGLQADGGSQAVAQRPLHDRALKRQNQPRDAHQRHNGEADVGRHAHLAAFQAVEQQAVEPARHRRNHKADRNRKKQPREAGHAELDAQQAADEAADNADGQAEVQADAALNARQHCQHQHAVHAQTHERVAQLARQGQTQNHRQQAQQDEEQADNQPRHAHLRHQRDVEQHGRRQNQQAERANRHRVGLTQNRAVQAGVHAAGRQRAVILQFKAVVLDGDNTRDRRLERSEHIVRQRRENRLNLFAQRGIRAVHLGRQAIHRFRRDEAGEIDRLFFHRHVVGRRIVCRGIRSRVVCRRRGLRLLRRIGRLRARFFGKIRLLRRKQHIKCRAHRLGIDFGEIHCADTQLFRLGAGLFLGFGRRFAHGRHAAAALARLGRGFRLRGGHIRVHRAAARRIENSLQAHIFQHLRAVFGTARIHAVQADAAQHHRQHDDNRRRNHLRACCPQLRHAPRLPSVSHVRA